MKISEIKINNIYKIRNNQNYFKVIELFKPKQGENYYNYTIVKGQWSSDKEFIFGLVKYFRPSELIEI